MHIGLNAQLLSSALSYRQAGISRYIYNLATHLTKLANVHTYTAFVGQDGLLATAPRLRVSCTHLPGGSSPCARILWEQVLQPWLVKRGGMNLLHCMAYVQPLAKPCPTVITVHDLSFLRFPEYFPRWQRRYLAAFTPYSVRRADAVIAVSQNTKNDLMELMGLESERIAVVYSGVGEGFRPAGEEKSKAFRERKPLQDGYLFFLGTLEPRKNLVRLLEAYSILKQWGVPAKLVLAGPRGWLIGELEEALQRLGLEGEVLIPGFIDQEELPLWYSAAEVFVYPSLYEGFGLPVLEAMACGTPVVAAKAGALPEVVGEAGLTVSPHDVQALAETIDRVLRDGQLRQEMVKKGLRRAKQFSWKRTAQETVAVYEKAVGRGS